MKFIQPAAAILLSAAMLACAGGGKKSNDKIKTGWVNSDTLVVSAEGSPPAHEKHSIKRRMLSKEQASVNAMDKIFRECLGSSYPRYRAHIDAMNRNPLMADYHNDFTSVKTIKIEYDPDDNCVMYVEFYKKNIKHEMKLLQERFR